MITISGTVHYTGTNVTECCMRFVLSFPARSRILSHLPVYLDSRRGVTRCLLTFHLGYSCSLPVLSSSSSLLPTLTQLSHFVRFLFVDSSVVTHSTFRCLSSIAFFNYKPPPPPPAPPLRMCLCLTEFASHFAARFPSTSPPPPFAHSPLTVAFVSLAPFVRRLTPLVSVLIIHYYEPVETHQSGSRYCTIYLDLTGQTKCDTQMQNKSEFASLSSPQTTAKQTHDRFPSIRCSLAPLPPGGSCRHCMGSVLTFLYDVLTHVEHKQVFLLSYSEPLSGMGFSSSYVFLRIHNLYLKAPIGI